MSRIETNTRDFGAIIRASATAPRGLDLSYLKALRWPAEIAKRLRSSRRLGRAAALIALSLRDLPDAEIDAQLERSAGTVSPGALALIAEAARRELGLAAYPVQLHASAAMLRGRVVEMRTGEGKTLSIAIAACLGALTRRRCHILTANDYLAQRDHEWAKPLFERCGITSGVVTAESLEPARRAAYACTLTYSTPREVAADYLRDQIDRRGFIESGSPTAIPPAPRVGKLDSIILDEADAVLIDDAVTPLILSYASGRQFDAELLAWAQRTAEKCREPVDFTRGASPKQIELTNAGMSFCQRAGSGDARARAEYLSNALAARYAYQESIDYALLDDRIVIIDPSTGRLTPDRSFQGGLHQALEQLHALEPRPIQESAASISFQSFFRKYRTISGASGTAARVAPELWEIYALLVERIPTNRPVVRRHLRCRPLGSDAEKLSAVVEAVRRVQEAGRTVLIGCHSLRCSDRVARALAGAGIEHNLLNAVNHANEARIIADAGHAGAVTVATNMAGRGTDIKLEQSVRESGGLHVILAEPLASHRLEEQLSGRAGRQGDPGSVQRFVCPEDHLFVLHAPRQSEIVPNALLGVLARWIQRRTEHRARAVRREALRRDDQTNELLGFAGSAM